MTKPVWCHRSTMSCNGESCILYVAETDQCFDEIEKNHKLSQMRVDENTQAPPEAPIQQPVVESMKLDKPFPELIPKKYLKTISGRIASAPETREVDGRDGPVSITNFTLTDGAIEIRVGIWEVGDGLDGFNVGAGITLTNMSVKDPYAGVAQISSTRNTKISR